MTRTEKAFVRFWAVAALLSLLFSFGRHAPFYKLIYSLPYFSTIRNPVKFMHPFSLAIVVMFGYGLQALLWKNAARAGKPAGSIAHRTKLWWAAATPPERKWARGSLALLGVSLMAFLVYASSASEMSAYLNRVQIPPEEARLILKFSYQEIGWFLVFLLTGIMLFVLFVSGFFGGSRWKAGILLFGAVLTADMVRANMPWIVYYDYRVKYASNQVIDFLRDESYKHRVTTKFTPFGGAYILSGPDQMNNVFSALCNEWLQHHFQYYRIQSLDVIQMPRVPELDSAFAQAFRPKDSASYYLMGRLWQLTNTRYLLGERSMLDVLNGMMNPTGHRFTILTNFDVVAKNPSSTNLRIEDFTAQVNSTGRYSIFEFGGALPRAILYSEWQFSTNEEGTLSRLADPNFNASATALVNTEPPFQPTATNNPGTVSITKYLPKRVEITADVKKPSLLVLFDRYDPQWSVTVDGKEEHLVRANYIFRGVYLPPGVHQVRFTFRTPLGALYISLAAIATGVLLCLYLAYERADGKRARH